MAEDISDPRLTKNIIRTKQLEEVLYFFSMGHKELIIIGSSTSDII